MLAQNPRVVDKIKARFEHEAAFKQPHYSGGPLDRKIGARLRSLRKHYQLSQLQLGKILNLSRSSIGNIEIGSESLRVRHMIVLCAFFEVPMEYFTAGNDS